ncbi:MAG: sugar phosphate isomerase/epimerase, partial [Clostridia bacterium]|nr:sugar phosphate isomerase/epimerase [Clostridia bacterium]
MNLSFSTRGRTATPWENLTEMALENGFTGIEVYDAYKDAALTGPSGPFNVYHAASTLRALRDLGLSIPLFDSSCRVGSDEPESLKNLNFLIELSGAMQTRYVALRSDAETVEAVQKDLDTLLPEAEKHGVTLLIKTNGLFSNTARLRDLLDAYASDALGVLWDVHHPYRDCGETPDETIRNLGAY